MIAHTATLRNFLATIDKFTAVYSWHWTLHMQNRKYVTVAFQFCSEFLSSSCCCCPNLRHTPLPFVIGIVQSCSNPWTGSDRITKGLPPFTERTSHTAQRKVLPKHSFVTNYMHALNPLHFSYHVERVIRKTKKTSHSFHFTNTDKFTNCSESTVSKRNMWGTDVNFRFAAQWRANGCQEIWVDNITCPTGH